MQCTHYTETVEWETDECGDRIKRTVAERCRATAVCQIIDPEGGRIAGCFYCREHAIATTEEYREKLREHWGIAAIPGDFTATHNRRRAQLIERSLSTFPLTVHERRELDDLQVQSILAVEGPITCPDPKTLSVKKTEKVSK